MNATIGDLCPLCRRHSLVARTFHGDHPAPARDAYYCTNLACLAWFERIDESTVGRRLYLMQGHLR